MKNAIVFGATSGIGKKIIKTGVHHKYKVASTDRRINKLKALKKYLNPIIIKQNNVR